MLDRFENDIAKWKRQMRNLKRLLGTSMTPSKYNIKHDMGKIISIYQEMNQLLEEETTELNFFKSEISKLRPSSFLDLTTITD